MRLPALALLLLAAASAASALQLCQFYDAATKATFDLSELTNPPFEPYVTPDSDPALDFTYHWNVCGLVNPPIANCTGDSPAWQVYNGAGVCYRLGNYQLASNMDFALIDPTDPTEGVAITYRNGQTCAATGAPRQFTVRVLCKAEGDAPVTVGEDAGICHYTAEVRRVEACPLECPVNANRLCSGHGHCEFDPVAGRPRCLCNEGFVGESCAGPQEVLPAASACDGTCGAMIFLMIVLIAFIVLVSAAWYNTIKKHRGYIGGADLNAGLVSGNPRGAGDQSAAGRKGSAKRGGNSGEVELDLED